MQSCWCVIHELLHRVSNRSSFVSNWRRKKRKRPSKVSLRFSSLKWKFFVFLLSQKTREGEWLVAELRKIFFACHQVIACLLKALIHSNKCLTGVNPQPHAFVIPIVKVPWFDDLKQVFEKKMRQVFNDMICWYSASVEDENQEGPSPHFYGT